MRLSKARKEIMEDHKGLKLSRAEFTFMAIQDERANPKKNSWARRIRNSIPGYYNPRSTPSKYPYNPLITKAAK